MRILPEDVNVQDMTLETTERVLMYGTADDKMLLLMLNQLDSIRVSLERIESYLSRRENGKKNG